MAATVPVFLKHTFISKANQAQAYTARAHSRYVQRESATHSVSTYLMPDNYQARQRWFFDHENGLRKNGRVIDKFTITIPYAIKPEHAEATLMEFGKWLGQERCPFMFSLQGVGTSNYHAHFIFVDRDFETGKRVYGTTEKNSTRGIKLEWETAANNMFASLGYDIQLKVKDWQQEQANDNAQERNMATEPDSTPEYLAWLDDAIPDAALRAQVISRALEYEYGIDAADMSRSDCLRAALKEFETEIAAANTSPQDAALESTEHALEESTATASVTARSEDIDMNRRELHARIEDYLEGLNPGDEWRPTDEELDDYWNEVNAIREAQEQSELRWEEWSPVPLEESTELDNVTPSSEEQEMAKRERDFLKADPKKAIQPGDQGFPTLETLEEHTASVEAELEANAQAAAEAAQQDGVAVIERAPDNHVSIVANKARLLYSTLQELEYLRTSRRKLEEAQAAYQSLVAQRERAAEEASKHLKDMQPVLMAAKAARKQLAQHQTASGKLKGFGIKVKLFKLELDLKTPARKVAEQAQEVAGSKEWEATNRERDQKDLDSYVGRLDKEATTAEKEAFMRANELSAVYGDDRSIANAERTFENTMRKMANELLDLGEEAVMEAMVNDEISVEEVRAFAAYTGNKQLLTAIEEGWDESPTP